MTNLRGEMFTSAGSNMQLVNSWVSAEPIETQVKTHLHVERSFIFAKGDELREKITFSSTHMSK